MDKNTIEYKIKKCILCDTPTNPEDSDELFCSACGSPLINSCSNYKCQKPLNTNAAYCKYCGTQSVFLNAGLVKSKKPSLNIVPEDFLF